MTTVVKMLVLEPTDPSYLEREHPDGERFIVEMHPDGKSAVFVYPIPDMTFEKLVAREGVEKWRIVKIRPSQRQAKAAAVYQQQQATLGTHLDASL